LIFKELARQTVVCVVVLLSAQKRNYDLLLKPCQAVRLSRFVSLAANQSSICFQRSLPFYARFRIVVKHCFADLRQSSSRPGLAWEPSGPPPRCGQS
ncbi:hypothetical protein, partial [Scleromatobacter humisilvae]